ncbi:MAG: Gfo/Idh/MocA family oxidoreductase [Lentisphaerae bacterium]|nr:Gfo/Idh/MocA family oxidoreductase [Lentisphaerota bacterium]
MKKYAKASDIKVGTIGYGPSFGMGKIQLDEMKRAGMRPVAVTELDPARRKAAEEEVPGIETFSSVSSMLKNSDVDLVAIITPHNTHTKLALQCLRAGRHVVTEKPFSITTAQCDRMIREAKKRRLMLSTYHNRHWDGCILEAVKRIRKQKQIGDVVRVKAHMGGYHSPSPTWRGSKSISGGILYDWGVHLLEYSLQIIDSEIVEVSAYSHSGFWSKVSHWKKDTHEDEACAVVRFANGARASLMLSCIDSNPSPGFFEVTGTKGSYISSPPNYRMIRQVKGKRVETEGEETPGQWQKFYRNIVNHLVKGEALVISPEWARRPIHILDLADRSAKLGKALKAKYA